MIRAIKLMKYYDTNKVLNNLDISINEGIIYGLVGKNGAGKTTLLTILAGLISADSGEIIYDLDKHKIRFLPDVPEFYDYLTCREYLDFLMMGNKHSKWGPEELLNIVKLNGSFKIKTMSRGMKQRLGVAASLINDPELLLWDEPTSALDPTGRYEVFEILAEIKNLKKTVILSTHILDELEKICDIVGFLHEGNIAKEIAIQNLNNSNEYQVSFEDNIDYIKYEADSYQVRQLNEHTSSFLIYDNIKLKSQQDFFDRLASTDVPIKCINNNRIRLEDIFKEVYYD